MSSLGKHKPTIGVQQSPIVKRRQSRPPLTGRAKLERELDLLARLPSTSRYVRCVHPQSYTQTMDGASMALHDH